MVHRGTLDYGHYYAFIRPRLDDRWFEFNDVCVKEVSKEYAIRQGCGGTFSHFSLDYTSHDGFPQSSGWIRENQEENNTNAYMLIYVRESERKTIMEDYISVDQQIPRELQLYFRKEERLRKQITDDLETVTNNFNTVFILSEETLLQHNWDGSRLSMNFRHDFPDNFSFET